jgi:hypothetical protein
MVAPHKFLSLTSDQVTAKDEETFFTSIMAKNGTYKTTFQSRFVQTNEELLHLISSRVIRINSILDIGISSGISTLELYEHLSSHGYETRIVGTDLLIDAYMVAVLPGCYALVDQSGFPLLFDVLGQGMKPWVTRQDYASGFFLVRKGINTLFRRLANRILSSIHQSGVKRVKLVTPRLLKEANIRACEDDITRYNPALAGKFDFVRAANVLNRGYFGDDALRNIIANIKRYMMPSCSTLLVMRTHEDRRNHGTLFRLEPSGHFISLRQFGDGSEIEHLVLQA